MLVSIHPYVAHAELDSCLHDLAVDHWMRVLESVWGVQLRQEDTLQPGKLDRPLRKLSGGGIGWKSWTVEPGVCVHARVCIWVVVRARLAVRKLKRLDRVCACVGLSLWMCMMLFCGMGAGIVSNGMQRSDTHMKVLPSSRLLPNSTGTPGVGKLCV